MEGGSEMLCHALSLSPTIAIGYPGLTLLRYMILHGAILLYCPILCPTVSCGILLCATLSLSLLLCVAVATSPAEPPSEGPAPEHQAPSDGSAPEQPGHPPMTAHRCSQGGAGMRRAGVY